MLRRDHGSLPLSLRTCIGCRTIRKKKDLQRLVMRPNKEVVWDPQQKLPGRGAYVCNLKCLKTAIQTGNLNKAFRQGGKLNLLLKREN